MFSVWLAGDHLYGKWLFTWLSLVMSFMVSYFVLSLFPVDVFDETWPRGYKTFSMLNSVEHEILNAHKYKNIKIFIFSQTQISRECYFSCSYMLKCQQMLAF